MEEIQNSEVQQEPEVDSDNSADTQISTDGQAQAPSELILGKFKTVEDLSKAYKELEKFQGVQSQELGILRQKSEICEEVNKAWEKHQSLEKAEANLKDVAQKYNSPSYFQDPSFREIFKEAYLALGDNLDADKFVNLIEGYVSSRIFALEKEKAAKSETQNVIDSMSFSKNETNSLTPPKKRLDEMTEKEVDELLERLL